jgi:hypothetical protein
LLGSKTTKASGCDSGGLLLKSEAAKPARSGGRKLLGSEAAKPSRSGDRGLLLAAKGAAERS